MRYTNVLLAQAELKRFTKALNEVIKTWPMNDKKPVEDPYDSSKARAAARRASMDLTRALAQFRKSSWAP